MTTTSTLDQHRRYAKCNATDHAVHISSQLIPLSEVRRKLTDASYCLDDTITQHLQGLPTFPTTPHFAVSSPNANPPSQYTKAYIATAATMTRGQFPDRLKRKCEAAVYAFVTGSKSATLFEPSFARPPTRRREFEFRYGISHRPSCISVWFGVLNDALTAECGNS